MFSALDLSIDRCAPGTSARRLLEGAAVFAPEAVPIEWAERAAGIASARVEALRARAALKSLGLVVEDGERRTVSMHRLVHRRVRVRVQWNEWQEMCRRGAARVAEWIEKTVGPSRGEMELVEAHRLHIGEALLAAGLAGEELFWIGIADRLATHLHYRAVYGEALELFQQALARAELLTPENPEQVATRLGNLAGVLRDLGKPMEAKGLMERALRIAETTYGSDHPVVAIHLSNLATVLSDLDKSTEAKHLLERALRINEHFYGPEHPAIAVDPHPPACGKTPP